MSAVENTGTVISNTFFKTEALLHTVGRSDVLKPKHQGNFDKKVQAIAQDLSDRKVQHLKEGDHCSLSFGGSTLTLTITTKSGAKRAGQVLRTCPINEHRNTVINLAEGSELACPKRLAAALSGNIQLSKAACQDSFLLPLLAEMDASEITGFSFKAPISDKAYGALIAKLASDQFADATYLKLAGVNFTSAQMVTLLETLKGHKTLADLNLLGSEIIDDTALRAGLKTFLAETPSLNRIGFTVPELSYAEQFRGWLPVAEDAGLEQIEGELTDTYGRKVEGPQVPRPAEEAPAADDGAGAAAGPATTWAATAMAGKPSEGKKEA